MKRRYTPIMIVHLSALLLLGCGGNKDQEQEAPTYPVVEIPKKSVTSYNTFPARVEGTVNVEVRPKISGFIEEIYIDEGQWVKKGEKLFKLEARSLQGEVNAASSAIQTAKANVATAQVEVDKLVPLVEEEIISEVQLESAKAKLEAAKSQLAQSRDNYNSLKENIDYQYVFSSVDGIVGSIPYRQGNLVGADLETPLTVVSEVDSVYVYFSMNEKEYFTFLRDTKGSSLKQKINNFPDITLMLADNSEYENKGKIQTTTGQIDAQTGTATFRAIFPNGNGLLNSGNSGTIKIPKQMDDVILVPAQATTEEQSKLYVYRVGEGDTIRRALITSAESVNNLLVVTDGLKASDRVVASGLNQLQENTRIQPQTVSFDSIANSVEQVF